MTIETTLTIDTHEDLIALPSQLLTYIASDNCRRKRPDESMATLKTLPQNTNAVKLVTSADVDAAGYPAAFMHSIL